MGKYIRFEGYTDPVAREAFFQRTLAMQATARSRYSSFEEMVSKTGKVHRFTDDPRWTWGLNISDTVLIK